MCQRQQHRISAVRATRRVRRATWGQARVLQVRAHSPTRSRLGAIVARRPRRRLCAARAASGARSQGCGRAQDHGHWVLRASVAAPLQHALVHQLLAPKLAACEGWARACDGFVEARCFTCQSSRLVLDFCGGRALSPYSVGKFARAPGCPACVRRWSRASSRPGASGGAPVAGKAKGPFGGKA